MLLDFVGDTVDRSEAQRACDRAPRLPVAGTSMVSSSGEEVQDGPLFLDDVIPLRVAGALSEYSFPVRVCSESPLMVWCASSSSRISVSGRPRWTQMDSGGEGGNETRADFCAERNICFQFQGREPASGYWGVGMVWRAVVFRAARSLM